MIPEQERRLNRSLPLDEAAWQALDYLNLYRLLLALLAIGLLFTPLSAAFPFLAESAVARFTGGLWLLLAMMLYLVGRADRERFHSQVLIGLTIDLTAVLILTHQFGGPSTALPMLLIPTVGAGALLLPVGIAITYAVIAAAGVLVLASGYIFELDGGSTQVTQAAIYAVMFLAIGAVGHLVTRRTRESQQLARQRGEDLADLASLNELIIQRMRTGILVVDHHNQIRLMNEAAWYLAGMPSTRLSALKRVSAELAARLERWRASGEHELHPLALAEGVPPIVPRFAHMGSDRLGTVLLFLEDTSMVSRRAEEMTLASMGRLAASIAHEIRNPLGAISHSAQLLAESEDLGKGDQRLTEIIVTHCRRMNRIIESVLGLARRERAQPENIELEPWLRDFTRDFLASNDVPATALQTIVQPAELSALIDPDQLQQVVWNLCQNALKYGRREDQPPRVLIRAHQEPGSSAPLMDIIDYGPGIAPEDVQNIFQPFFTSSTDGTGLGLYIATQLCRSNQGDLMYLNDPEGGSCFRIKMAAPRQAFQRNPVSETA